MFYEVSYLGDKAGDLYRSLGWPTRAEWIAAGRPRTPYPGRVMGTNPVPPVSDGGVTPPGSSDGGSTGTAPDTPAGSSGGGFLSGNIGGIPILYLVIGAAVLMVMKK